VSGAQVDLHDVSFLFGARFGARGEYWACMWVCPVDLQCLASGDSIPCVLLALTMAVTMPVKRKFRLVDLNIHKL
jgi:hypothetical protein